MTLFDPALLSELLRKSYAADPWHGPGTAELVGDLSAAQAAARPVGQAHSVWELVLHMTGWQREVLRRLRGGAPALPAEGDWPEVGDPSPAAWDAARAALASSLAELAAAVAALGGDRSGTLATRIGSAGRPLGTGVTLAETLVGILQHDAYHGGQIALLRKTLGR